VSQKQNVAVVVRGGVVARGKAKGAARVGGPRRSWVKGKDAAQSTAVVGTGVLCVNRQTHVTANATQKVVSSGAQTWAGMGIQESNLMVTFDDDDDEETPVVAGLGFRV
jgi:hypothetical protein